MENGEEERRKRGTARVLVVLVGLLFVSLGALLELGHRFFDPKMWDSVLRSVEEHIVWSETSPKDVQGGSHEN